jgi:hypothetical protein
MELANGDAVRPQRHPNPILHGIRTSQKLLIELDTFGIPLTGLVDRAQKEGQMRLLLYITGIHARLSPDQQILDIVLSLLESVGERD